MAHQHTIKRGETLLNVADHYGFADWKTIWDHPNNGPLRQRRDDPQRLVPGDELHVPDKGERWVKVSTNQKHVFELRSPQSRLKVALEDRFGSPYARRAFKVLADDKELEGRTDDLGVVDVPLPCTPGQSVLITLPKEEIEWQVEVGTLYPLLEEDVTGYQAALQNLGFLHEPTGDACTGLLDDATGNAIFAFQERYKVLTVPVPYRDQKKASGKLDPETKAKLAELVYAGELVQESAAGKAAREKADGKKADAPKADAPKADAPK